MAFPKTIRTLVFIMVLIATACNSAPKDEAVEIITTGNDLLAVIHTDRIRNREELKISDLLEDVRLVHLETNPQNIFNYPMRIHVGPEYILISTIDKGILMFSADGSYLSNLAPHGKGPGELMDPNRNMFVDEKNDLLYVADFGLKRGRMIVYEIKTGHYREITAAHQGPEIGVRDIIVQEDSLMYITTMQVARRKSDCPLFCQTTSGRLLWEIRKTHPLGYTESTIQLVNDRIYFNYMFDQDTTWMVEGQRLRPLTVITTEVPRAYRNEKVGSGYVALYPVNGQLFLGFMVTVKAVEFKPEYQQSQAVCSPREFFIFDSRTNQARLIGEIRNDFLGSNEKFFLSFHSNGLATATYQAFDLLHIADSISRQPNISSELKLRLQNILNTVNENDNPVLLVGKIRK